MNKYVKGALIFGSGVIVGSVTGNINMFVKNERNVRRRHDCSINDIVFATSKDAKDTLRQMLEILDTCGVVTETDFYDLVGLPLHWSRNVLGWTKREDIVGANVSRVRDGYTIKLSEPKEVW